MDGIDMRGYKSIKSHLWDLYKGNRGLITSNTPIKSHSWDYNSFLNIPLMGLIQCFL
jgi:hypothetical protein